MLPSYRVARASLPTLFQEHLASQCCANHANIGSCSSRIFIAPCFYVHPAFIYIYILLPRTAARVIPATQPYTFLYVPSCTFTSLFSLYIILSILFLRVSRSQNIYSFARCFQDTHTEDSIFFMLFGCVTRKLTQRSRPRCATKAGPERWIASVCSPAQPTRAFPSVATHKILGKDRSAALTRENTLGTVEQVSGRRSHRRSVGSNRLG